MLSTVLSAGHAASWQSASHCIVGPGCDWLGVELRVCLSLRSGVISQLDIYGQNDKEEETLRKLGLHPAASHHGKAQ